MTKKHQYATNVKWTGNLGDGTKGYASYTRDHIISVEGKPDIMASSDVAFRGDASRHNPEDLFLASLSSCHMLWYLHLCSVEGVVITAYRDRAEGIMEEDKKGSGKFTKVVLKPLVEVASEEMKEKAIKLHHKANEYCFIANSCNFPITHEPKVRVKE
ncbi:OsmC family protein [Galbibacter mesophilus]|uniref:OsmC family protein n=1 Tax=Galbibacter mesophilus TaxID=379069 RepID=UPI00191DD27D|nr:OsmC family protein [Galbibacter mesophilus]MCM5663128.1 OsmC family protein [Galbibacter mesophilus]